ncbi:MAG: ArsR/SmtB family transcription factor [Acidimicrobiia bacterium]
MDDMVFKALDDPSRRLLLDALFERDGQSLGELAALVPSMTRYGVMNHLSVLSDADLVVTVKDGRRKLHYLNPIPIQTVHERWITKYTERKARVMTQMKSSIEGRNQTAPDHVYQIIIDAPTDVVWNAIVDGDVTVEYFYGTRVESTWLVGDPVSYLYPDGSVAADGTVIAIEPGVMVERYFHPRWDTELEAEGPAREIWRVDEIGDATRLTIELFETPIGSKTHSEFSGGLVFIASGMKTLLETGSAIGAA